jgi:hypothetical protein
MIPSYFDELTKEPPGIIPKPDYFDIEKLINDRVNASLKTVAGIELPDLGRSSKESPHDLAQQFVEVENFFQIINPALPFDFLDFLAMQACINPDVSQAVKNYENFANTGHQIEIEASSPQLIERAIERVNSQASKLYKKSCGVDGLINHYIRQIATFGALSSEDIIANDYSGVEEIAIVPVSRIRFKLIDGKYVPHQMVSPLTALGGYIELNENTYSYYAWRTVENSPYAYPPFTSAIESLLMQHDMTQNIRYILRKMGLLGLVAMILKKPAKHESESDDEYLLRSKNTMTQWANALLSNYYKGMIIMTDDQDVKHFNVAGDARGGKELFDQNEQQVFSGLGTQPALHGRTYSTTETYAGVVYNMLVTDSLNIQRLPKRRMERTYMLDLLLQGLIVDSVSLQFNETQSLKPLEQANTDKVRAETEILKMDKKLISPDQAAQALGYDQAFSSEMEENEEPEPQIPEIEEDEESELGRKILHFKKQQQPHRKINRKVRFEFSKNSQRYRAINE